MVAKFNEYFNNNNDNIKGDNFEKIKKYNNEWKSKFPELKSLKLDHNKYNNKDVWTYTINKEFEKFNFALFLEISNGDNWSIDLEMDIDSINNDDSYSDTKVFTKKNLNYDEFITNLEKVIYYIRTWNRDYFKKSGENILKG